nr:hypothetical protein [Maridesulfovibrio frigidus]
MRNHSFRVMDKLARTAFCVAAAGTTTAGTCVLPTATGTSRITVTGTLVFVFP